MQPEQVTSPENAESSGTREKNRKEGKRNETDRKKIRSQGRKNVENDI